MNDLISRRALCDFALNQKDKTITPNDIMRFPAADPEKHGKWLEHQNGKWVYAKCSKCKTIHDVKSNYCPDCGARMDEELQYKNEQREIGFIYE